MTNGSDALDQDTRPWNPLRDRHHCALVMLTGKLVHPMDHPRTVAGLDAYLSAWGVAPHFRASELVRPYTAQERLLPHCSDVVTLDEKLGAVLLPARWAWPRGALILWLLEHCRVLLNAPIGLRYWWRPPAFNAIVGGANASDHLEACAIDVLFASGEHATRAYREVLTPHYESGELQPSLGWREGSMKMHIGLLSSHGKRRWSYPL